MLVVDKNTPEELFPQLADIANTEGFVLCINKPLTWTSADVVRKIKFRLQRIWGQKKVKVGHAGTLDPLATGVLMVCVGKATKQADYFQAGIKEYSATLCFGATTPSFDLEKEIDARYPWEHIDRPLLESVLASFLGEQLQAPPVYSAKMVEGIRAYERMRQGLEIPELQLSPIRIDRIDLLTFEPPLAQIHIVCSKGTYVRALARDLGLALQSGAHLIQLERTHSGDYGVEQAILLENFENMKLF